MKMMMIQDFPFENMSSSMMAKRRATMALKGAHEALRLSLSTPRIGAMLKEIEKELNEG